MWQEQKCMERTRLLLHFHNGFSPNLLLVRYCYVCQPNDGKDMIGRPARDEGPEDQRDRLQRLFCSVLCLDLLLLLPPESDHDVNEDGDDDDYDDDGDNDGDNDGDDDCDDDDDEYDENDDDGGDGDEPDSLANLVDQVRPLCPRRGFHQLRLLWGIDLWRKTMISVWYKMMNIASWGS